MSRKLSLATLALFAALLATPVMAQQPTGKDSTHAAQRPAISLEEASQEQHLEGHHQAATAKKDSTSKK
jgi:hypothetical protein